MTEKEKSILRSERVQQLKIALNQKAAIAKSVFGHFGDEGKAAIREGLETDLGQWIESVKADYAAKGRTLDIQGLHDFLWEPNRDEEIEFEWIDSDSTREYTVKSCPLAAYSIEQDIAEWGYFFFCRSYEYITKKFNPGIVFNRTECLMNGDSSCHFSYSEISKKHNNE